MGSPEDRGTGPGERTFVNPVISGELGADHGDPFVIRYLDQFFLYHTGASTEPRGIRVYSSKDLVDWEFRGHALEPRDEGWNSANLWAPEVVYNRGVFYMYVSATPANAEDDSARRLGIARSDDPVGPFVWDEEPLVGDNWSKDGHPFRDDDGSTWLFYGVHLNDRGSGTVVERLTDFARLSGGPSPVTSPSADWEFGANEAPYVLKRRGRYFQMYTGGDFESHTAGIGIASAPSLRGPWTKDPGNPVFASSDRLVDVGHHSVVSGPDGATRYAVYHAHVEGDSNRQVCVDRLFWVGDKPWIAGPTEDEQPFPPPPVYRPAVPHWRADIWAQGKQVRVGSYRFELDPPDVFHQVEVTQSHNRLSVRIGGVLVASHSDEGPPSFDCDGQIASQVVTSYLEDGNVYDLPPNSMHEWDWGDLGPIEIALAVKGNVTLSLDARQQQFEGPPDRFRLLHLYRAGGARWIAVTAGDEPAAVADLAAYARPDRRSEPRANA